MYGLQRKAQILWMVRASIQKKLGQILLESEDLSWFKFKRHIYILLRLSWSSSWILEMTELSFLKIESKEKRNWSEQCQLRAFPCWKTRESSTRNTDLVSKYARDTAELRVTVEALARTNYMKCIVKRDSKWSVWWLYPEVWLMPIAVRWDLGNPTSCVRSSLGDAR